MDQSSQVKTLKDKNSEEGLSLTYPAMGKKDEIQWKTN